MRRTTILGIVTALCLSLSVGPAKATPSAATCAERRLVTVLGTVAGTLCRPARASVVHLLLAGSTYNRSYWDFPYEPARYSYTRAMNAGGVATFAIDRIGNGSSTHPLSVMVTTEREAVVTHQLVQLLHREGLPRVVTVGNSSGSVIALVEADRFHDVAGVIISGLAHRFSAPNLARLAATTVPAVLDARFAGSGLDPGYLTFSSAARTDVLRGPTQDPAVVALDEATKDLTTATGQATVVADLGPLVADAYHPHAPVLVALGGHDTLFCAPLALDCSSSGAVLSVERRYFHGVPVDAFVLPDAPHCLNLAPNAPEWHAAALRWTATYASHRGGAR